MYNKEYYDSHKASAKDSHNTYVENNREHIREYNKAQYHKNKLIGNSQIKDYEDVPLKYCINCDRSYKANIFARHQRSKKHIKSTHSVSP